MISFKEQKLDSASPLMKMNTKGKSPYQGLKPENLALKKEPQIDHEAERQKALEEEKKALFFKCADDSLAALRQALDAFQSEAPKKIVEMGLMAAREILKREVVSDPGILLEKIQSFVKELPKPFKLFLNPQDRGFLKESRAEAFAALEGQSGLSIVEDTAQTRGSCRLESEKVEASVDFMKKWELLWEEFFGGQA